MRDPCTLATDRSFLVSSAFCIQDLEMARAGNAGFELTREDVVVEIHLNPRNRNQNDLEDLLHSQR